MTYIVTEGRVDAAAVGKTVQDIQNAVDAITDSNSDESKLTKNPIGFQGSAE